MPKNNRSRLLFFGETGLSKQELRDMRVSSLLFSYLTEYITGLLPDL